MQILIAAQGVTPNSDEINTNCILPVLPSSASSLDVSPPRRLLYRRETFMKRLSPSFLSRHLLFFPAPVAAVSRPAKRRRGRNERARLPAPLPRHGHRSLSGLYALIAEPPCKLVRSPADPFGLTVPPRPAGRS